MAPQRNSCNCRPSCGQAEANDAKRYLWADDPMFDVLMHAVNLKVQGSAHKFALKPCHYCMRDMWSVLLRGHAFLGSEVAAAFWSSPT